jgi:hypothetical protein
VKVAVVREESSLLEQKRYRVGAPDCSSERGSGPREMVAHNRTPPCTDEQALELQAQVLQHINEVRLRPSSYIPHLQSWISKAIDVEYIGAIEHAIGRLKLQFARRPLRASTALSLAAK